MSKEYIQPRLLAIPCYMLCFLCGVFVNMQGKRWEIYSFFSVGKKREGKCSFCFFVGKARGKKQNVHFPLQWAFSFVFSAISEECKFQTQECSFQSKEYKFQTLQYKLQSRKYNLQSQEYNFQSCQYILQTRENKKILTEYSVRIQEYKNRTLQLKNFLLQY